jgi:hypothetical protein
MKNVLLIGFGSEIGSMLIYLNNPKKDNLQIKTVITKLIDPTIKDSLNSLKARLIILNPTLINSIKIDEKTSSIIINDRRIKVIWSQSENLAKIKFKNKFDATIVATSKSQINNKKLMLSFLKFSHYVFGVAENKYLPAIYPSLLNVNDKFIANKKRNSKEKIFVFGSCQSNGWMSSLAALLDVANKLCKNFQLLNTEVDIVHPDTPTGRLGTKSLNPREQDPRDNLRPSFSQVSDSMKRLFPRIENHNTVSLRTLISPPGYMISRFYFKYEMSNNKSLNYKIIRDNLSKLSTKQKFNYSLSELSLGSKAFSYSENASNILSDKKYLIFKDNVFKNNSKNKISELIIQSYVHNTRGYCRSVIEALKWFFNSKKNQFFL